MSQIIVEQQFPYHVKMTSNRHFSNAIYPNRNAKLEKLFTCAGRAAKLASLAKFLWWQKFSLIWSLHIYIYIYMTTKKEHTLVLRIQSLRRTTATVHMILIMNITLNVQINQILAREIMII